MYAVIETGGKQYRVSEGDVITIEKLKAETDSEVLFDKVLVIGGDSDIMIGTPYLDAAKVQGSVLENGKAKKVIIFKYKSKKDYRKKQGHRQPFTAVRIDAIMADGKPAAKKAAPEEAIVATDSDEGVNADVNLETLEITADVENVAVGAESDETAAPEKKRHARKAKSEDKPAEEEKPETDESAQEEEKKPAVRKTRVKKEATEDGK